VREYLTAEAARACTFLGAVSDEEKASLLASTDLYVAPNTGGESFGIILIEAMAASACVVASDLPAFVRVLDDGTAGATFRNEEPDDLARVVSALLSDPTERQRLATIGRARADLFDWSVVAADVMAVYETVVDSALLGTPPQPASRWARLVRSGRRP